MKLSHIIGLAVILSITYFLTVPAWAETTGSIAVTMTYTNGDTADYWPVSLKIYQDFNTTPYKEIISLSGNPFNIVSLPVGHKYKIEAYADGMYSSVNYVDLQQPHQDINTVLPLPGGMRVNVFYNDGTTPISNATVYVRSQNNKTWVHGPVDINGKSTRFWIEPTTLQSDHYIIDVKIGDNITYSQSPIVLRPGIPQEIKIVTSWPPIVNTLITVNVLDIQSHHVSSSDGKFTVELYDNNGNMVSQSPVTIRGLAYFSNLKVGDYIFKVMQENNTQWGTSKIIIDGSKLSFDVFESQKTPALPMPVPVTPQPLPPEPVPVSPSSPVAPNTTQATQSPAEFTISNCNCVAFRLDNVQDYWLDNVQTKIIDIFDKKNASLTIGIIGNAFGNDAKLTDNIKSKIDTGKIDVAINGWSFEDFTTDTEYQQVQLLEQSKNKISTIFGTTPSIFIPPYGKSNNDTFYAMINNDIYFISGNADTNTPLALVGKIHSYPPTVFTDTSQYHNANQSDINSKIMSDIRNSVKVNGYAIVTINFQDEAQNNGTAKINIPDIKKIQNLESMIDGVRNNGYQIVTIKAISNPSSVPEFDSLAEIILAVSIATIITIQFRIRIYQN